jgi:hypothetical protein
MNIRYNVSTRLNNTVLGREGCKALRSLDLECPLCLALLATAIQLRVDCTHDRILRIHEFEHARDKIEMEEVDLVR